MQLSLIIFRGPKLWVYIYHKQEDKHFKDILKFVLSNTDAKSAFNAQIVDFVQYFPVPDEHKPVGLQFHVGHFCIHF